MNYFAHGRGLLDRPYALAGSALPDWLSAADRRARVIPDRLGAGDLADGVRRHLADDAWFHSAPAFLSTSGEITRLLRRTDADPRARCSFFGHVLTEMMLDAALIETQPEALDAYYDALDAVAADRVVAGAGAWVAGPLDGLGRIIDMFRRHRFLYGYRDDDGLFARLRAVAGRAGLRLPDGTASVLPVAREMVSSRAGPLLEDNGAD